MVLGVSGCGIGRGPDRWDSDTCARPRPANPRLPFEGWVDPRIEDVVDCLVITGWRDGPAPMILQYDFFGNGAGVLSVYEPDGTLLERRFVDGSSGRQEVVVPTRPGRRYLIELRGDRGRLQYRVRVVPRDPCDICKSHEHCPRRRCETIPRGFWDVARAGPEPDASRPRLPVSAVVDERDRRWFRIEAGTAGGLHVGRRGSLCGRAGFHVAIARTGNSSAWTTASLDLVKACGVAVLDRL